MQGLQAFHLSILLLMLSWPSPITAQQCTGSDVYCSADCKQIYTCIDGIPFTGDCPTGTFCDAVAQDCSATSCDSTCTTYTFECTAAGTFPDPYSCSNFIQCPSIGGTPTNTSCPSNTKFNPCTAKCSADFSCTTPRVQCTSKYETGNVLGNPEMFYTCNLDKSCAPVIRKCSDGYIYNSVTEKCISVGYDVCQEQPYTCVDQGFHPDPNNCTVYYYCGPNFDLRTYVCKPGYHYVQSAEGCLSGSC